MSEILCTWDRICALQVLCSYLLFCRQCQYLQGVLKVNQKIEIRPGIVVKDEKGSVNCTPIYSRIVSSYAEQDDLQLAVPWGLIGVVTTIEPTLTRADCW